MTALRAASATNVGKVRPTNQDLALVTSNLVAVADGMGGHAAGDIAARTAVEALRDAFKANRTVAGLIAATQRANQVVFDRGERENDLRGMGTTLTAAALITEERHEVIGVVNVGDSRAYLLEGGRINRLTEDHSLVEEMVRQGEISAEQASTHPHRHILTRALGIDPGIEIDSWVLEPYTGMRLLLCSDGLTNECTDEEIASVLTEHHDPSEAAELLVERALSHGGSDNVTVVVADVEIDMVPSGAKTRAATTRVRRSTTAQGLGHTGARVRAPRSSDLGVGARPTRTRAARPPAKRLPRDVRDPYEHILTPRVALFALALVAILGGAFGFIAWFDRASYFVGLDNSHIAIFNGRPGGLLWFKPTVAEITPLTSNDVLSSSLPLLRSGILESSFANAKNTVVDLSNEAAILGQATSSNTTTTIAKPSLTTTSSTAPVTKTSLAKAPT